MEDNQYGNPFIKIKLGYDYLIGEKKYRCTQVGTGIFELVPHSSSDGFPIRVIELPYKNSPESAVLHVGFPKSY